MFNLESENYLRSYLYKARVLLIGGGEFDFDYYSTLDHDIWVRVNNHYLHQGGRVDVLYTAGLDAPERITDPTVIVECHPLPDDEPSQCEGVVSKYIRFDTHLYQDTNPFGPENEWLNNLHRRLNTMPFTGMIAVEHLLSMPIAELELAGFDFYQRMGIVPRIRDTHGVFEQIEWLAEKCILDKRIIISDALATTLDKFWNTRAERR